jgi:hypothetical protein
MWKIQFVEEGKAAYDKWGWFLGGADFSLQRRLQPT